MYSCCTFSYMKKSLNALGSDFWLQFFIDYYVEPKGMGFEWICVFACWNQKPCSSLSNIYLLPISDLEKSIVFYDVCVSFL